MSQIANSHKAQLSRGQNNNFGPSGVRALPVAAGTNEGGHYFLYFFPHLLLDTLLPFTPEGIVVGF